MKPRLFSDVGSQHARRVRVLIHELGLEVEAEEVMFDSPSSWEKRRGPNPTFASRHKWARIEAAQHNRGWLSGYKAVLVAWRDGIRDVVFPAGTWLMVKRHGCRCAAAPA